MLYYLQKSPVRKVKKNLFSNLSKPKCFANWFDSCLLPRSCLQMENMEKSASFPANLLTASRLCRARLRSPPLFPLTLSQYWRGLQEQEVCRLPASCLMGCMLALEADACWGAAPTPALVSGALLAFWNHLKPFASVRCCSIGDGCGSMYIMKMKNRPCGQLFF